MRLLILFTAALALGVSSNTHGDPFAFFHPDVVMTARQRAVLERGLPVVSVLDTEGHELAVFTAIVVDSSVTADRMIAWIQNVAEFRKSSYVLAVRRFSSPPLIEDLDTLALDDSDLEDIEGCRPGDCGLKLSAGEIEGLQRVIRLSGNDWKGSVQAAFRQIVLQRVAGYAEKGHTALDEYRDSRKPRSPAAAFSRMLQHTTFLLQRAPTIADVLTRDRGVPAVDAEEFIYWSKERFGKAVVSATHVRIFRPTGMKVIEVVMTGTQIFATHYLDACFGVTALIRDQRTSRRYFVYFNRADVDLLGGFWGRFARGIIEARVAEDGPAILRDVAHRLSSGDPLVPAVNAGPATRK